MIPKLAVKAYLSRQLDDHRWIKSLCSKELDVALAELERPPEVHPGLFDHQKACLYLGIAYPQFAFWLDMGTGKTNLALHLIRYWLSHGEYRALVVVKNDKAFPTWRRQMKEYGINLPHVFLDSGSSKQNWKTLDGFEKGVIFVTYPGLLAMVCELWRSEKRGKNEMGIVPSKLNELCWEVGVLVLDESTTAGNRTSLTYKVCNAMSKQIPIRYALAGRPFGRDPTMLWAQHYLIDRGETLGETVGLFREAFFTAELNPFSKNGRAQDYTFIKSKKSQLMRLGRHRSLTYGAEECIDLPKLVSILESVKLPEEAGAYYRKVVDAIIAARGNLSEMKNAFMRMRQLSSGFLGFRDDDTGERSEIAFDENPKMDRALELLDGLPEDRKCAVFYEFTYSGRLLMERLKEQGQEAIWLWSGTKNSAAELARFVNDPKCTVAVIQNKVGAYSIDELQVANYQIFYESPVGVIDREQAERRLRRQGQKRTVFMYDMITEGTLDRKILDFHQEGDELLAALRADPAKVLGK